MSDEAAKHAATAAKQATHAVKNIETAAELQAAEVVQDVVSIIPPKVKAILVPVTFIAGGAGAYHFGTKALRSRRLKKGAAEAAEAVVEATS